MFDLRSSGRWPELGRRMYCVLPLSKTLYPLLSFIEARRWSRDMVENCFFFLSCISLFGIAFTHHNQNKYWNIIFNTAQQKFCTSISQGHNLCKLKYLSLGEVKIVYFQK